METFIYYRVVMSMVYHRIVNICRGIYVGVQQCLNIRCNYCEITSQDNTYSWGRYKMGHNMKIILPLFCLILLFLASVASATGDISLNQDTVDVTADVSEVVSGLLTISNINNIDVSYNVSLPSAIDLTGTRNNETGVSMSYIDENDEAITYVILDAGSSAVINYSFTVPSDAFSESYTGILNFTADDNNYAEFTINLDVNAAPDAAMDSVVSSVTRGHSKDETLIISNTGNTDLDVSLSIGNLTSTINDSNVLAADYFSFNQSPVAVLYKTSGNVVLTMDIPADTPAESYTGNMTMTYNGQTKGIPVTITVNNPLSEITLSATEISISGKPGQSFSQTFTVQNTGTLDLSGIAVAHVGLSNFNISYNTTPFDLTLSEPSRTITITGNIPKDINTKFSPFTGVFNASNAQVSEGLTIQVEAQSMLKIEDLDFVVDDDTKSVSDGTTVSDVRPSDRVIIEGKIRNLFRDVEGFDIDIEDVEITITIDGIDDGKDLDENERVGRIKENKRDDFRIDFKIPEDADEEKYDVLIEVEGDDDNGAFHYTTLTAFIDVERKSHELDIRHATLALSALSCVRSTDLYVNVKNIGSNEEDEVYITVASGALGISEREGPIKLDTDPKDRDSEFSNHYTITIPSDFPSGTHQIEIKAFYETDVLGDVERIDLAIEKCGGEDEEEPPEDTGEENQTQQQQQGETPSQQPTGPIIIEPTQIEEAKEISAGKTTYLVILTVIIVVIAAVIVNSFLPRVFKRK